jgi:hypothetical protein
MKISKQSQFVALALNAVLAGACGGSAATSMSGERVERIDAQASDGPYGQSASALWSTAKTTCDDIGCDVEVCIGDNASNGDGWTICCLNGSCAYSEHYTPFI